MPSHRHGVPGSGGTGGSFIETRFYGGSATPANYSALTNFIGGGLAHNNLQPYLTTQFVIKT